MDTKLAKILIVEDEIPMLEALRIKFSREGFEVITAEGGEKGLAAALEQHPDLILLDIIMPGMGGLTVLEKLREDSWGQGVPVILLTNLTPDDKTMKDIEKYRPSFYLIKSDWKIEDLVSKVKERLGTE